MLFWFVSLVAVCVSVWHEVCNFGIVFMFVTLGLHGSAVAVVLTLVIHPQNITFVSTHTQCFKKACIKQRKTAI